MSDQTCFTAYSDILSNLTKHFGSTGSQIRQVLPFLLISCIIWPNNLVPQGVRLDKFYCIYTFDINTFLLFYFCKVKSHMHVVYPNQNKPKPSPHRRPQPIASHSITTYSVCSLSNIIIFNKHVPYIRYFSRVFNFCFIREVIKSRKIEKLTFHRLKKNFVGGNFCSLTKLYLNFIVK